MCVFFIDNYDTGRDAGAVEEVSWQADDAFDETVFDEILADCSFGVTSEEDTVGKDDSSLPPAFKRPNDVEQESVVAVLGRRDAVLETFKLVVFWSRPFDQALSEKGGFTTAKSKV